jgi:septal ring factor EnvC (AmiA/AmiB activator)
LALAALAAGVGVSAQNLVDEQRSLIEARKDAEVARLRAEALLQQAKAAQGKADRSAREAAALAAQIEAAQADMTAATARIAIVERLQRRQAARLAEQQQPLVRLTAMLQTLARRPAALNLFEPGSLDEIIHARAILSAMTPEISRRTADVRREIDQSQKLRAQETRALRSLQDSRSELAQRRKQLAALEKAQRIDADSITGKALQQQDRAIAMGEEARDIVERIDRIRDAAEVRAALAALSGPVERPTGLSGETGTVPRPGKTANVYRLPVKGQVQTGLGELSPSGYRARGLTILAAEGADVIAPAAGRVTFAGPYRSFGVIVIIDHGKGWTSLLTGMADTAVTKGETIVQGKRIGAAGSAPSAITVELRRRGRPMDIAALL